MPEQEDEVEVMVVPASYERRIRRGMWLLATSLVLSLLLTGFVLLQTRSEFAQHRLREQEHQCFAARDHLTQERTIRNLAKQAGLDPRGIPDRLEPEVQKVCDAVDARQ